MQFYLKLINLIGRKCNYCGEWALLVSCCCFSCYFGPKKSFISFEMFHIIGAINGIGYVRDGMNWVPIFAHLNCTKNMCQTKIRSIEWPYPRRMAVLLTHFHVFVRLLPWCDLNGLGFVLHHLRWVDITHAHSNQKKGPEKNCNSLTIRVCNNNKKNNSQRRYGQIECFGSNGHGQTENEKTEENIESTKREPTRMELVLGVYRWESKWAMSKPKPKHMFMGKHRATTAATVAQHCIMYIQFRIHQWAQIRNKTIPIIKTSRATKQQQQRPSSMKCILAAEDRKWTATLTIAGNMLSFSVSRAHTTRRMGHQNIDFTNAHHHSPSNVHITQP